MPCDITKKDMESAVSNTQVQIFLEEYAVTGQAVVVRAPKGYSAHMQYIVPAPFLWSCAYRAYHEAWNSYSVCSTAIDCEIVAWLTATEVWRFFYESSATLISEAQTVEEVPDGHSSIDSIAVSVFFGCVTCAAHCSNRRYCPNLSHNPK